MIRSLFHIPIITITYNVDDTHKLIKCTIHWRNPANNNIQKSIGVTKCNPNDIWNETLGKRIAESRAKMIMLITYKTSLLQITRKVRSKHMEFLNHEIEHHNKLIS